MLFRQMNICMFLTEFKLRYLDQEGSLEAKLVLDLLRVLCQLLLHLPAQQRGKSFPDALDMRSK